MNRVLVGILSATLLSCGAGAETTGMTSDSFIEVMVELRRTANQAAGDTIAFVARREQILLEAGITEEQLREYVEAHGRDVEHMARIWEAINTRLADLEEQPLDAEAPADDSGLEGVRSDEEPWQQAEPPPARQTESEP
jgi:hypothetical protein